MARIDLAERIRGRTRVAVAAAGRSLESFLRANSPYDTGATARNTYVVPRGPGALEIIVATDYASFLRDGTRPHVIRPRTRQYLAFEWAAAPANMGRLPDGRVLARYVNHPGTKPNAWYVDGISRLPDLIQGQLASSRL